MGHCSVNINVMNQAQFEQLLANDVGGCSVFARKGDNYTPRPIPLMSSIFEKTEKLILRAKIGKRGKP